MQPLDMQQLMMLSLASQGVQGLGESFIRGDALRRGLPVPHQQPQNQIGQMMQFAQMQRAEDQRRATQEAIGGLKDVPADVRTLMSLYPEEAIKPYIQGQFKTAEAGQDIWSSPAGLYSKSAGGIIPGTGPVPKEPGAPVLKEFSEGDRTVMKQWTGQGWEPLSSAPRWQPDKPGSGGGASQQLAPYLTAIPTTSIDPATGEIVTANQFWGATRQKGQIPTPQPIGAPIETKRDVPKANEKFVEMEGILDSAKSSLDTLRSYQPTIADKAANAIGMPGPKGAAASSAQNALLFSVAKLAEQGALQAPDKAVAEGMIGSINDPRLSEAARHAKIAEFDKWIDVRVKANTSRLRRPPGVATAGGPAPAAPPAPTPAPAAKGSRPSIKTKADFDALPSGAEFIAPDGSRRRKP